MDPGRGDRLAYMIFHSFFYDLPMNLIAFLKDFQNRICFIAQEIYPSIMKLFSSTTNLILPKLIFSDVGEEPPCDESLVIKTE